MRCVLPLTIRPWALVVYAALGTAAVAGEPRLAFLACSNTADRLPAEARAAYALARTLAGATLVSPSGDGRFVDAAGNEIPLAGFTVVWHHEGDTADPTGVHDPQCLEALRGYVGSGHGLLLSGAALALVRPLGVETARPRLGRGGKDRYVAQIIPLADDHPVFRGLTWRGVDLDESVGGNPRVRTLPITDAGFPAFADFYRAKGPAGGRLLARSAAGDENPLVEYAAGNGRIIAMGWRLPHYSHESNAHRANLCRLTRNILEYLGDRTLWQPVRTEQAASSASPPEVVADSEWRAFEMALQDLIATFGDRYPHGREYLARLERLRRMQAECLTRTGDSAARGSLQQVREQFRQLRQQALLANPLLDFDRLLLVERSSGKLGLPANWQSNSSLPTTGYDNRLAILSPVQPDGELRTLLRPDGGRFVGDVDLHFDAERILFSMPGSHGRWQVFEMRIDGSGLRELPLIREPDVDNYDACYLPDGRVVFTSTATFVGVPCVYGNSHVTNTYRLEEDGSIRQLTVDQDHNWCPTVTNTGRVLYLRWEYTDLPHSNSRILFHMNPDGTSQMEYYGSNSFFPNSFFYARPIPGHPTRVVGIGTGHHGVARSGRLLIIDPALGRREADGVVQEIPGRGMRVPPKILDPLVDGVWPQFLHPFPLSDKYFLVSARPSPQSLWGIYLVDVFDNMVLLKEKAGYALFEPVPIRKTARPPVVADRIDRQRQEATVFMTDIYRGEGLRGIPRGTVKALRLISYQFSYREMGGLLGAIGMDGPWDIKRVLGTVPVEADGSANFRVPACTPIAVQPLDADGRALQLMRSWFTAMPGEVLSCVGCHEPQNSVTPNRPALAAAKPAAEIVPWYGEPRGFSFAREVQPVLDRYSAGCHNGHPSEDGRALADLRGTKMLTDWTSSIAGHVDPKIGGKFSAAYAELHRFVRRPGIESDIRLLSPMEFHAGTTELVQMIEKGHHGVCLDREAWDRLVTWIDLNAPYHGTWTEIAGPEKVRPLAARAREMRRRYTGRDEDLEAIPPPPARDTEAIVPGPAANAGGTRPPCAGWPFDSREARRRQVAGGVETHAVTLGQGVSLQLVRIPPGAFVMGDSQGEPDERPPSVVNISRPFWIGRFEVTNEQFRCFDPAHDSRVEPMHGYQFGIRGYPVDKPQQPVVRVSWNQAMDFCGWLSRCTGRHFTLPSEAQWEYACRAGTDTPMWYGDLDTDFSATANLGDARLKEFALDTYIQVRLIENPNPYDDWVPKDDRFDDGSFLSAPVGSYRANPWGLCDMHGNVWEWTRSAYRPYPYDDRDGRNAPAAAGLRVVRGGSWYDRPKRCRSASRLAYAEYQPVFNVGFRVIMEDTPDGGTEGAAAAGTR